VLDFALLPASEGEKAALWGPAAWAELRQGGENIAELLGRKMWRTGQKSAKKSGKRVEKGSKMAKYGQMGVSKVVWRREGHC